MLDSLISSKTRKILINTFFTNPNTEYYIRQLASLNNISTGSLHREITMFERKGLLKSRQIGNVKLFSINKTNPYYDELRSLVIKAGNESKGAIDG